MTSISRTITTSFLDWRGIVLQISFERQRWVDHLEVRSIEPQGCPLSITETGYVSRFIGKDTIPEGDNPATYVEAWLDQAAKSKSWGHLEMEVRQLALL